MADPVSNTSPPPLWRSILDVLSFGMGSRSRYNGFQVARLAPVQTSADKVVGETTAEQNAAVNACINLTAKALASMPLRVCKADDLGNITAVAHPLNILFSTQVNANTTAVEWLEYSVAQLMHHGNAYSVKRYGARSSVIAFDAWPAVSSEVENKDGEIRYYFTDARGIRAPWSAGDVIHLKLRGNTLTGDGVIGNASTTIGTALAIDDYLGRQASKGFRQGGVLTTDGQLSDFKLAAYEERIGKMDLNGDNVIILENGMTFTPTAVRPVDAQLSAQRTYSVEDIARFFLVPPGLLTSSPADVGALYELWFRTSIGPLSSRISSALTAQLLTTKEIAAGYVLSFDSSLFTAVSREKALTSYPVLVEKGIVTPNEARRAIGLPLHSNPAANELFQQAQMVRSGSGMDQNNNAQGGTQ